VENRVLPAGPTVVDIIANAAFYFGMVRMLAEAERPVWTRMSFASATEDFHQAARLGMEAHLYWPGLGTVPASELVLRRLLPMAHEGLDRWGVDPAERDRLLGIIERRCVSGVNGATWQVETVRRLAEKNNLDRPEALRGMLTRYIEHMHGNAPVHEWPRD
jgi:hypothetical protein